MCLGRAIFFLGSVWLFPQATVRKLGSALFIAQPSQVDQPVRHGPGEQGEQIARAVAADKSMANDPIQPGEGPTKEERDAGHYDILFVGYGEQGQTIKASVQGDKDPGYGSTSKMIAESAVCLLENPGNVPGGIYTPAPALGGLLVERLQKNAGLTFTLED